MAESFAQHLALNSGADTFVMKLLVEYQVGTTVSRLDMGCAEKEEGW